MGIQASMQLLAIHNGRDSWLSLAFSGLMLMVLLSPHAWRICEERSRDTRPEAGGSGPPGLP